MNFQFQKKKFIEVQFQWKSKYQNQAEVALWFKAEFSKETYNSYGIKVHSSGKFWDLDHEITVKNRTVNDQTLNWIYKMV